MERSAVEDDAVGKMMIRPMGGVHDSGPQGFSEIVFAATLCIAISG
jgi:hypothetical protein